MEKYEDSFGDLSLLPDVEEELNEDDNCWVPQLDELANRQAVCINFAVIRNQIKKCRWICKSVPLKLLGKFILVFSPLDQL